MITHLTHPSYLLAADLLIVLAEVAAVVLAAAVVFAIQRWLLRPTAKWLRSRSPARRSGIRQSPDSALERG